MTDTRIEPMAGYFVWTKKGSAPRFHHHTLESAQAEADRLARFRPGQKFIVMQAVSKHSVPVRLRSEPSGEGELHIQPSPQALGEAA